MQINLTGFLNGRNARSFMGELWDLLVSAQESVTGIPEAFLQQKKDQIKKRLVIINFLYIKKRLEAYVDTTIVKYSYLISLHIISYINSFIGRLYDKFYCNVTMILDKL